MTDGTVLLLPDGQEAKAFHIRDGLALVLGSPGRAADRDRSRDAPRRRVARRAAELEHDGRAAGRARQERGLPGDPGRTAVCRAHEVAYIGDDVNDLSVMSQVGLLGRALPMRPSRSGPRPSW